MQRPECSVGYELPEYLWNYDRRDEGLDE